MHAKMLLRMATRWLGVPMYLKKDLAFQMGLQLTLKTKKQFLFQGMIIKTFLMAVPKKNQMRLRHLLLRLK